jgi:NADH-quinone oxidoreductase subunit L
LQTTAASELIIWVVLLTPLASFLICLIVSDQFVRFIAPALLLVSALGGLFLFFSFPNNTSLIIQFEWFRIAQHTFTFSLEINRLSQLMLPLITGISFLVHLYSVEYMRGDTGIKRYFAMLGFFTFSMLGIVFANDLLIIFIFWELVGFSSYMLIGHWLEKPAAAKAAQKAFIFNRIGDAGFLVGIMILWANTGSLNLTNLLHLPDLYSWQTAASLCIFCGVIGKSAQLPLFSWLPDAMEGPTPVSALIHAATMVAAGVFLLARLAPLFTPTTLTIVAITGSITAVTAAICALNQFDIKKILAYSTISQLGLMVTAVGVGSENSAMLHLFTHAFFKAGLFLAAGAVLHSFHAYSAFAAEDIRNLGGLRKKLPITFFAFLLLGASLSGIPLLSGFISKDSILTSVWNWSGNSFSWKWTILLLVFVVTFITVLYTFRLIWSIFFGNDHHPEFVIKESPWAMRLSLILLTIFSLWFVVSPNPLYASGWFVGMLGALPHANVVTLVSIGLIGAALVVSWIVYTPSDAKLQPIVLFQKGFKLDALYQVIFIQPTMRIAMITESLDRKWIDRALHITAYAQVSIAHVVAWFDTHIVDGVVYSSSRIAGVIGSLTRSFQGGKIQLYIFWAVAGVIIFLFFALI